MLSRGGDNLHDFVRFAWELGLAAGKVEHHNRPAAVVQALASRLNAAAWIWQTGRLHLVDDVENGQWKVDWTEQRSSSVSSTNLSPVTEKSASNNFNDGSTPLFTLQALFQQALDQQARTSEVNLANADPSEARFPRHQLMWVSAMPNGTVERFQLTRASGMPAFNCSDSAMVQTIVSSVFESVTITADQRMPYANSDTLPKRQSEVLELLLRGASIKEIASELGISPHTVKDYSRALYRHFDVCGRAELAAFFRGSENGTTRIDQLSEQKIEPSLKHRTAQLVVS